MDLFYSCLSFAPFWISWIRIHGPFQLYTALQDTTLFSYFLSFGGHFGFPGSGSTDLDMTFRIKGPYLIRIQNTERTYTKFQICCFSFIQLFKTWLYFLILFHLGQFWTSWIRIHEPNLIRIQNIASKKIKFQICCFSFHWGKMRQRPEIHSLHLHGLCSFMKL